ncbi:amino acid permease 2 [Pseudovirgaria hyperparasitica]|uniref:Amino acid permease 2 n=1 Tax=Pseudovirgaria hyperparasitica TaxID=470096 RepID=A0A6A6WI58_9PEZI|nr:amino acid permease 2 [Pseudovirgaria hyperparasitica]KAF2761730.1 amino acid permease 2 [Pseudovirgaria hyperparasitica]
MTEKGGYEEATTPEPANLVDDMEDGSQGSLRGFTHSTSQDLLDMKRMGKAQQLIRYFRTISAVAFVSLATVSWELNIFFVNQGLRDGGRAGLMYSQIWCFVLFGPVYLSLAEMASMAPIAGSQYHWVSEFAPAGIQKPLSYITGWTSTLAWQAGNTVGVFLVGTLIQTIIALNDLDYAPQPYQSSLLVWAAIVITYLGSVYGMRWMSKSSIIIFVLHFALYPCFLVPVWLKAPKATSHQVWLEFSNLGGWQNMTLAIFIGQLSSITVLAGIDNVVHVAEEVQDASKTVPRAMLITYLVNWLTGFPALITLVYALPDLDTALLDPSGYPLVFVLRQIMSTPVLTAFLVAMVLIFTCSNITYLVGTTRDLFAFARDNGLPFSAWLSHVNKNNHVPEHAVRASSVFAVLLSLIYIGSPVAFYAITSLFTVAIFQCYIFSIGCVLYRRIYLPGTLPPARFSLGKWGVPTNCVALFFSTWAFFWAFWPQTTPFEASAFNWASVIFVAVVLLASVWYVFKGRHQYNGPVTEVKRLGPEQE